MYLSSEILRWAFKGMSKLDVSDTGKSRQERASALTYLYAVSNVLKQQGASELDVNVDHVENRAALKETVEEFLRIPGSNRFTVDFYRTFSESTGVSSNFLTTVVRNTRGQLRPKEYPGRPANGSLLSIREEKISVLGDAGRKLKEVYNLQDFKTPLVLWILKLVDFGGDLELNSKSINSHIKDRCGASLASVLSISDKELGEFIAAKGLLGQVLVTEKPDVSDLYVPPTSIEIQLQTSVPTGSSHESSGVPCITLPKPFLLLAGISGTGKSRFVDQQAKSADEAYQLVAVRPDWHEPSDLQGYVSRLGEPKYVVTPFLKFLVRAWLDALESFDDHGAHLKGEMKTFWLCLDEMNLAPVEQYFSDYLSVLETRKWNDGVYCSAPFFRPSELEEKVRFSLCEELGLNESDQLWQFFMSSGIQLPPNLVVAGTVNMDETTHGFSRKVIDRAYTIDFGEFFPNVFEEFFAQTTQPIKLSYSRMSSVPKTGPGAIADADGAKSIEFLACVNRYLADTPFQLAYRALNELLVMVACFAPLDDRYLQAVWDDYLMAKLLPRIEGDVQKIGEGDQSLLRKLLKELKERGFEGERPDLMRVSFSGDEVPTGYRSVKKLEWMQKRLEDNGFTSFWP